METSADPYELKLYQMFQSCDTDCSGLLNEDSLRQLCLLLELTDKGAVLIENLSAGSCEGDKLQRVSFDRFKEALLNFLGTEIDRNAAHSEINTAMTAGQKAVDNHMRERSLIISDEVVAAPAYIESPPESPDREVSPKLVVGSKKYGRRSRPQTHAAFNDLSPSDSDENGDAVDDAGHRHCSAQDCEHNKQVVQRSSSQTDIAGGNQKLRLPIAHGGGKLKRCASLPAQRNAKGTPLKSKATANKNTQQHQMQQSALSSSVESLGFGNLTRRVHEIWNAYAKEIGDDYLDSFDCAFRSDSRLTKDGPSDTMPARDIIEIWERANVANGKGILLALGFDEDEVNVLQLNKVFEEELRSLESDDQMTMVRAALALQSAEISTLRHSQRQLQEENKKLHSDNKEANRRVSLLALEIDERHASLEDSTKKEIVKLEQRHSGVVRELTARMASDRENWNNLTARLEARIKTFEQDEIRMKTELELVHRENGDLESIQQKLEKQVAELLEKNIKLTQEVADLEDAARSGEFQRNIFEKTGGQNDDTEDEMLHLMEKISTLQLENKNLRDKNDELVVEVENLNIELMRSRARNKKPSTPASSADEMVGSAAEAEAEHGSAASSSAATKRRGDSPSKALITEESPRTGKLRKCATADGATGNENSDTSGEWMALNSELQQSHHGEATGEEAVDQLRLKLSETESQLKKALAEKAAAEERCKELDASLEQMQRAYEDCEDYWQAKLTEERQLFEKERQIYEEEQQESDKKFTELMEKVREYEDQFSKDGRLSPIEEKDTLEQQYADLEAEAEEIRENARRMFEEKSLEIDQLQSEIEDLRLRLGESVEILTGASELTNVIQRSAVDLHSPASSPISYLWHQSTIQEPAKNIHCRADGNPTATTTTTTVEILKSPTKKIDRNNLSTSETTIFSTTPLGSTGTLSPPQQTISPIQKPTASSSMKTSQSQSQSENGGDVADCETSSTTSGRSYETHSVASTHNIKPSGSNHTGQDMERSSPSGLKEELKRLKFFEISLKEQIKDLSLQRDGLVMELQQLQEAKPVLEKAYARTAHPSLMQRVNQLELRNRHLQNVIKQQQQYTESLMQQSWQQHQMEVTDLRGRLEAQVAMLSEQSQRLQNADILAKDLYVENSHLTAAVQRLELQQTRMNMMHQHHQHYQQHPQQQQQPRHQGLNGLPGMP